MRARTLFQFAAFFALVLSVAASSMQATQRRDPLVYQDGAQTTISPRANENAIKTVKHVKKPVHAAKKSSTHAAKTAMPGKKDSAASGSSGGSR